MSDSRDDFIIAIRYALLKKGANINIKNNCDILYKAIVKSNLKLTKIYLLWHY